MRRLHPCHKCPTLDAKRWCSRGGLAACLSLVCGYDENQVTPVSVYVREQPSGGSVMVGKRAGRMMLMWSHRASPSFLRLRRRKWNILLSDRE